MAGFLRLRTGRHPFTSNLSPSPLRLLLHKSSVIAPPTTPKTPKGPNPSPSPRPPVAVFWDLDNKPPNSIPPHDAAVRLNLAASSIGPVRFTVAYANHHAFRHLPAPVRAARSSRRALDRLEDSCAIPPPAEPYVCRVCGRNFYNRTKLVNHFRQLHEREQAKRIHRLESARGARRARLAGQLSMKMEKYKRAAGDVLVPKVGYGLADELRRAGVWVRTVDDKPEAADRALRAHMVETMDKGRIGCLMLVSDDVGFAGVLREARMRCLRTVVVGDEGDGALRRCADAAFSWQEVASGKARKEGASAVGRWKDRDLLKRLEWTYVPEPEDEGFVELDGESVEGDDSGTRLSLVGKGVSVPWWKLYSDSSESSEGDHNDEYYVVAGE